MANFDKACILAENLNKIFPDNVFVAGPSTGFAAHSNLVIEDPELGMFVDRVPTSADNIQAIGDSSLKSLIFREVFESRNIINRKHRATQIRDRLGKMLPEHYVIVCVLELNSQNYRIVGPTKGTAVFAEPEFKHKIVVALT